MTIHNDTYRPISTRHSGFTLLEVLVALIILAIGLLGLASLQAVGMRSNHSAQLRTQATILSYDIMDRVRANVRGLDYGGTLHYDAGTAANNNCKTADCDPGQMAAFDLFQWSAALANALPSGTGVLCIDSTPDDTNCDDVDGGGLPIGANARNAQYAVKISWCDGDDTDDDGIPCEAGELQSFVTTFRPTNR